MLRVATLVQVCSPVHTFGLLGLVQAAFTLFSSCSLIRLDLVSMPSSEPVLYTVIPSAAGPGTDAGKLRLQSPEPRAPDASPADLKAKRMRKRRPSENAKYVRLSDACGAVGRRWRPVRPCHVARAWLGASLRCQFCAPAHMCPCA